MCQTGSAPTCQGAIEDVAGGHLAVISESSPLRWTATLDGEPVAGVFDSVEEAAGAITDAMLTRHGLVPADQPPLWRERHEAGEI